MNRCEILDEKTVKQFDSLGSKIILVGSPKSGKTTILNNYFKHENNPSNMIVMFEFDEFFNIPLTFDEKEMYVQLTLVKNILNSVSSDNSVVKLYKQLIDELLIDFIDFTTRRPYYHETKFRYKNKFLLEEVINALKVILKIDLIVLVIDDFDKIYNSNKDYQELFMKYGKMFDKVIISSEDENILQPSEIERLKPEGFDVVNIKTLFDYETIKKVIISRFQNNKMVSINLCKMLTEEKLSELYKLTSGNFDIMFDILEKINSEPNIVDNFYILSIISECIEQHRARNIFTEEHVGHSKRTLHL